LNVQYARQEIATACDALRKTGVRLVTGVVATTSWGTDHCRQAQALVEDLSAALERLLVVLERR
jgi:hypothetical protein